MKVIQSLRSTTRLAMLACLCAAAAAAHAPMLAAQSMGALPVFERTLSIPADRPITIEATVAELRVTGWTRPDVEITMNIPRGHDTSELDTVIDDSPSALRIRAVQRNAQVNRLLRASIVMSAPAHSLFESIRIMDGPIVLEGLTGWVMAASRVGNIEGIGLAGVVRLEAGFGDVTLRDAELMPQGLLRLRAFNGDVGLQLRRQPADARILALTFNGRILSDIPLTMKTSFGPKSGSAIIGRGEPVIGIDVVKGDVAISVIR